MSRNSWVISRDSKKMHSKVTFYYFGLNEINSKGNLARRIEEIEK